MEGLDITGTWHLEQFLFRNASGEESRPFGSKPRGQLMYSGDGHMSVIISLANTTHFIGEDQFAATAQEKIAAYDHTSAYCGRYEQRDGEIVHEVEFSLFPNWVGTRQVRNVEFRKDHLILSMPPRTIDGVSQIVEAVWSRHDQEGRVKIG